MFLSLCCPSEQRQSRARTVKLGRRRQRAKRQRSFSFASSLGDALHATHHFEQTRGKRGSTLSLHSSPCLLQQRPSTPRHSAKSSNKNRHRDFQKALRLSPIWTVVLSQTEKNSKKKESTSGLKLSNIELLRCKCSQRGAEERSTVPSPVWPSMCPSPLPATTLAASFGLFVDATCFFVGR